MLPALDLETHRNNTFGTHNLHPYPAKFIPQIPSRLIEALSKPLDVVLDPFCGSGTTLVEARKLNRVAIGSDVNDLSVLIARAKSSTFESDQIHKAEAFFQKISAIALEANFGRSSKDETIPEFRNREMWFDLSVLRDLALIRRMTLEVDDDAVRTFLLVNLSSIVVRASRQDSETRWKSVQRSFPRGYAFDLLTARLVDSIDRIKQFSRLHGDTPPPQVHKADAKQLHYLERESVDLVVTSPPYLNSFDYYLYHKLRMFVLGIDHYAIQEAEIGSRNKHCDKKQSDAVYFSEMLSVFQEFGRVLKSSGRIVIVIGDAIYRGEIRKMDAAIADIAKRTHFRLDDIYSYDQRRYTRAFTPNLKNQSKKCHVLLFSRA